MNRDRLAKEFSQISSQVPRYFQSPGRINLIGDHTDYNLGFVMPAAINRYARIAMSLNEQQSLSLRAIDLNVNFSIPLDQINDSRGAGWMNYFIGVTSIFRKRGAEFSGIDAVISSDIPNGAGLSSSAALTCCFAFGLNELLNRPFEKEELVDIAQLAEHEFAGVFCGIMDQTASLFGKRDSVMKFDCLTRDITYSPFHQDNFSIVLVDTKVRHQLADTAYNSRRQQCQEGLRLVKETYEEVSSFQDVQKYQLDMVNMPDEVKLRCQFVVEENDRVTAVETALRSGNIQRIGALMYLSHAGLSKKYQVSCPELDLIVQKSEQLDTVFGARMMGGGFGGCCIALVKKTFTSDYIESLTDSFHQAFGYLPEFYEFELVDGATEVV